MQQQDSGRGPVPTGLRTSPTGRVPQWVLDEAVGGNTPSAWRSWQPAPRPRRRVTWRGIGTALVLCVVASAAVHFGVPAGAPPAAADPHRPTPGVESSDAPLGTPPAAPAGGGQYLFVRHQDDGVTPVGYDPCRPIHYVTRQDNAPSGGDQLVRDAVARISAVTGLQFVDDGVTEEGPTGRRASFQPDRYGDRWAPVLVAWDTVAEQPELAAEVAGLGGSAWVSVGSGPSVYVTGTVELDAAEFTYLLSRPDGAAVARAIVLHEFGHVVGLQHVDDPTQLMYPTTTGVHDFGDGDLAGLAQLGSGACVPSI